MDPPAAATGLAPSSEALIDRHLFSIILRHIASRDAGPDAPKNAIDDPTVVESGVALLPALSRQQILQQTPLRFAQIAATQSGLPPRGILNQASSNASITANECKERLHSAA